MDKIKEIPVLNDEELNEHFKEADRVIDEKNKEIEKQKEEQLPKILSARELAAIEFPPQKWLVEGFIIQGGITYFTAEPKTYKTRTIVDMAVCSAVEESFLGKFQTNKANVLFVDKENGLRTLQAQIKQICKGHELKEIPDNIFFTTVRHLQIDTVGMKILNSMIEETKANWIVLDPFVSFVAGDENSSKDVRLMHDLLMELMERDIAISIPHHFNKTGQYRGSSDIPANADILISLSRNGDSPRITIKTENNRHVTPDEFLHFDMQVEGKTNDYMKFTYLGEKEIYSSLPQQVSDKIELYLFKNPEINKIKKSQVTKDIVLGNNFTTNHLTAQNIAGMALKELVNNNVLQTEGSGWYSLVDRKMLNFKHTNIQETLK